jgi:hypothetical protein
MTLATHSSRSISEDLQLAMGQPNCRLVLSPAKADGSFLSYCSLAELHSSFIERIVVQVRESSSRSVFPEKRSRAMTPVVLQFGRYRLLLETRSKVLQMAGLSVVNTFTSEECAKEFLAEYFDLVILCHSLSIEERQLMASFVHRRNSSTPVILISMSEESDPSMNAVLGSEPQNLVRDVQKILRKLAPTYQWEQDHY